MISEAEGSVASVTVCREKIARKEAGFAKIKSGLCLVHRRAEKKRSGGQGSVAGGDSGAGQEEGY